MVNGTAANHEGPDDDHDEDDDEDQDQDQDQDDDHEYDHDYESEFLPMASHGLAPSHPTLPPTLSTTPRPAFVHPPFTSVSDVSSEDVHMSLNWRKLLHCLAAKCARHKLHYFVGLAQGVSYQKSGLCEVWVRPEGLTSSLIMLLVVAEKRKERKKNLGVALTFGHLPMLSLLTAGIESTEDDEDSICLEAHCNHLGGSFPVSVYEMYELPRFQVHRQAQAQHQAQAQQPQPVAQMMDGNFIMA